MSSEKESGRMGASGAVLDPTMSLVGRLEDLSLGEILQIVSLSKRSGLLRLEGPGGRASLFIKAGKVIFAASSEEKEGVLSLLAQSGLIEADQVFSFKEELESAPSAADFRASLEARTGISNDKLQKVLKTRVEELTYSLFAWEEGTFSFQLIEDESSHPVLSKVAPFFLDEGMGAQFLVMEGARRKDEMLRGASTEEIRDKSPMVDPGGVLGGDWEQEFEEHLTGRAEQVEEETPEDDLDREAREFVVPDALPQLPGRLSSKVVAVGLQPSLVVEITGGFVRAGIDLLVHDNVADALTRVQEIRQQGQSPYLLVDLESAGITDGRLMGGLEAVSTMWDFGFHLPVGLVCRRELTGGLEEKLRAVAGLDIFKMSGEPGKGIAAQILNIVIEVAGPAPMASLEEAEPAPLEKPGEEGEQADSFEEPSSDQEAETHQAVEQTGQGEGYYDIEQEFSEELEEIDLLFDGLDEGQAAPRETSSDPHMARLSSFVKELNKQDISGEITLMALRFASAFVNRAILFLVRKDDLRGLGQFGVDLGENVDADSVVRSLNLPLVDGSVFHRVARQQQGYKGPPTGSDVENALFEALGGGSPGEIFLGPVVSMGKVAVLLYGDDFPLCGGLEPTHTLDIFLSHVGLALDRAFLEMKLKSQRS